MQNNSTCAITVEVRTPDNCDFCLVGMICHSLEISLLGLSKYIPSKPTFVELIFGKSPKASFMHEIAVNEITTVLTRLPDNSNFLAYPLHILPQCFLINTTHQV